MHNFLNYKYNYYPFGSSTPGRSFSSGSYRYGFNGKENDNEVKGTGNHQDYGARIYDNRLGRFLSIDPLTNKYSFLTPYQFASNRPVDGIDVDGLEYITYKVTIGPNANQSPKIQILTDYRNQKEFNYEVYSQSFGPEGRGIKYEYEYTNEHGEVIGTSTVWEIRQSDFVSGVGRHGLYMGAGSITTSGPNGPGSDYNFNMDPIDGVDAAAKRHDIRDSELRDGRGWLEDTGLLESDKALLQDFNDYSNGHKNGEIDEYTGRPASKEALKAANQGALFFGMVVRYKEWKIEQEKQGKTVTIDDYKGSPKKVIERIILKKASTDTPK